MFLHDKVKAKGQVKDLDVKKETKTGALRASARNMLLSDYFVLYLSIAFFLVVWAFVPALGKTRNIENIFSNMWPLLILAIGQMFVLILGGIDLSQTGLIGFLSVAGSMLVTERLNPELFAKSPLWGVLINENGSVIQNVNAAMTLAILVMAVLGTLVGVLNGVLIAKLKMPAFIVTLVMKMLLSAVSLFTTKSENVSGLPDAFVSIGNDNVVWVLTLGSFIVIALCVVAYIILQKSMLGKWLYATGMNPKASKVSGIPVDRVVIFSYAFSGFCVAISSLLYTTRMMAGRPTLGADILMDIIGATVIGGTSMFGGKGRVSGTVFGVLFFVLISNALNHMRLDFATINIVKGAIILIAAYIDVTRMRLMKNVVMTNTSGRKHGEKEPISAK